MGSLLAFGYFLVGVPYFVLLGIGTGILNFIPYAANIGWPLAVLLKYLEAPDAGFLAIAVWPTVVFQGVLLLEEFVLVPFVQRRGTNLSAVVIVIAVFIGGAVAGFLGLMFAIPIAACIKIFFEEVLGPRLRGWADSN